ncbi:MAG: hypothetical protein MUD10_02155 [Candidatus Pacebacteria bacterium]|nr:hypothetical protein [Candidatus Paceibacterota bacterium]
MAIIFGASMQGRKRAVPKELYLWLSERNQKYSNIRFQIEVFEPINEEEKDVYARQSKYSIIYNRKILGVSAVIFPFVGARWIVRIIGGRDGKGNIAEPGKSTSALGIVLRREISGFPADPTPDMEQIDRFVWGVVRKESDKVSQKSEMVVLAPDGEWASEFSVTGQQLKDIVESHRDELKRTAAGNPEAIIGFKEELTKKTEENRSQKAE